MTTLVLLVIFLPFLGFLLSGAFGGKLGDRFSQGVTCGLMGLSATCASILFCQMGLHEETLFVPLFTWIHVEFFDVNWGLQVDSLSLVMMTVVTIVSFMVHIYSIGYMKGDPGIPRFMAYLSLFTFFMLTLVTAPNLLQLFFGWEGVGLCSYLLIGYYYDKPTANAAAIKAFIVNRVGDMGFALGIITLFVLFGTIDFVGIFELMEQHQHDTIHFFGYDFHALTLAAFLLFIGAMGKSAQIGLHTWLPDAMEGPTPVSALIHAATMVTAGVFMVVRMSPLFEYAPLARDFVVLIGSTTAFMAATIACVQTDIKRVIAYSTCSQLGYMFMAAGLSGYSAAIFHLTTHAFFKSLLFLGAGSVIHAMSGEQNMLKMGGIWRMIPATYTVMWIGGLALGGIPFFAGYYSKDMILEIDWASHNITIGKIAFVLGVAAAILTALYTWRLIILTFHGKPRADEAVMSHLHESPLVMLIPLFVLAFGATVSGHVLYDLFVGASTPFWGSAIFVLPDDDVIKAAHHVPGWVDISLLMAAFSGVGLAYLFYQFAKSWPDKIMATFKPIYTFLWHKWYFDELYDWCFVNPALKLSNVLWVEGDQEIIDGLGPDGLAALSEGSGKLLGRLQTGYITHYAFFMVMGVVLIIGWYLWL